MTKPTKQQILDCTDEKQLTKWAAQYCFKGYIGLNLYLSDRFNPCSPTVDGKAQAIDLAHKYKMEICFSGCYVAYAGDSLPAYVDDYIKWKDDKWQDAIVKAAIISAISEFEK